MASHRSNDDPTRRRTSTENTRTSAQVKVTLDSVETARRYHVLRSQGGRPNRLISAMINAKYDGLMDQIRSELAAQSVYWHDQDGPQGQQAQQLSQPPAFSALLELLEMLEEEDE